MCTVSFIPFSDEKVVLTSNRDEDINRPALEPAKFEFEDYQLIFPKDPIGEGSWISINNTGRFVCLLNGAFEKHKHQPPYRHSRGKVVIDFFKYQHIENFHDLYDLDNIEPFTLIVLDKGNDLFEYRWDGNTKHIKSLDNSIPNIYSSSTLYTPKIIEKRQNWFEKFLKESEISESNILNFHKFAGDGDSRNDLVMQFKGKSHTVQTTSVTQIIKTNNDINLSYNDLLTEETKTLGFNI